MKEIADLWPTVDIPELTVAFKSVLILVILGYLKVTNNWEKHSDE